MKIQPQTILSDKERGIKGNCLITTYACYLDLPVDECPQIQHLFGCKNPEGFWDSVIDLWLKELGYRRVCYTEEFDPFHNANHTDYYDDIIKLMKECAAQEAVAFCEWAVDNTLSCKTANGVMKWLPEKKGDFMPTSDLYAIYKKGGEGV